MHNVRMLAAQRQRVAKSFAIASGLTWSTLASAALTPRAQVTTVVVAGDAPHYVKIVILLKAPGQSQTVLSQAGPAMGIQGLTAKGARGTDNMTVEYVDHFLYVNADLGFLEGTFGLSRSAATPMVNKWVLIEEQPRLCQRPRRRHHHVGNVISLRLDQRPRAHRRSSTASRSRFFETRFPRPPHRQLSPRRCTLNVRDPGCQWNRASLQVGTLR